VQAIESFLVTPLANSCEHRDWFENPNLVFYDKSDPDYRRAVNTVQRKTATLNFHQLLEFGDNAIPYPRYFAMNGDHYMSPSDSREAVYELLLFQYNTDAEVVKFLRRLYDVCEKIEPKKNSMYINGPPNSGKTWFLDMVSAFHVNVGHVSNMVRGDHFPLNDCVNRRLLTWNEPSIMPSAYDTVKMIAGGDPCPANVKYQGHSVINRTPLIFTANTWQFNRGDPVWTSRMHFEQWRTAPLLKRYTQYPHPRAYAMMMIEFGII